MAQESNITIQEVIETSTGEVVLSTEILNDFNRSLDSKATARKDVLAAIDERKPLYLCASCHEPVRLNGGHPGEGKRALYFKHNKKHDGCIYTDYLGLTQDEVNSIKFHGLQEGETHLLLKETLDDVLSKEGYDVKLEKRVTLIKEIGEFSAKKNKRLWRQPDVQACNENHSLIFEIQLATTSINVIKARMDFYQEREMHILWVVYNLDVENTSLNFTQADILAYCNRNIFQLDDEMMTLSKEENKLHMKCWYRIPFIEDNNIAYKWGREVVTLDDLVYDNEQFIAYYYDSEAEEVKLAQENKLLGNDPSYYDIYTDGKLDLDKSSKLTLDEFIEILSPLSLDEICESGEEFLKEVKDFSDTDDLKHEFQMVELEQLFYVSFLRRINSQVENKIAAERLRAKLNEKNVFRFLIQLVSYPLKQVIGSFHSDLSGMTLSFSKYYIKYAHIVAAMIKVHGLDDQLFSDYNRLDDYMKHNWTSKELDFLATTLFQKLDISDLNWF